MDNYKTITHIASTVSGVLTLKENSSVVDITHDSRQVKEGWLFVAIRGSSFDGHNYVDEVLQKGCCGILSENPVPEGFRSAWIQVKNARRAMALAASELHGNPSKRLNLVGITGTNGKTTTSYLVADVASMAGEPVAMIGTVEYRVGNRRFPSERTTPESTDIQRFLHSALDEGCRSAVMECSSHAIDLNRCDALDLSVAVFTNLTRDHLDHHKTMDNYFAVKKRLFDGSLGTRPKVSVINTDDSYGRKLSEELKSANSRVLTYSTTSHADLRLVGIDTKFSGMQLDIESPLGRLHLTTPLVGVPHAYNILAAIGAGISLGYNKESITKAIATCYGAPGRFERVEHAGDFSVIVDYAHTDDALANVLRTARELTKGRVITLFGCGGDRDRTKRAPMGKVAAELSDLVILTSDNPRTEDPVAIMKEVEAGLKLARTPYFKIVDRREAIFRAIAEAEAGDLVMIAGKGHEDYQIIGEAKLHFNDREVAEEALALKIRRD